MDDLQLPNVKVLRLDYCRFTDEGFSRLVENMPKLERVLMMRTSGVTDEGLASLGRLQHLKAIEMIDVKMTDAGIKRLPKNLEMLSVRSSKLTSKSLDEIAKMTDLASLHLVDVPGIGDQEVKKLAQLTHLRALNIQAAEITNDGLKSLSSLHNLHALQFGGKKVTDEGLLHLRNLTRLNRLFSCDTSCTREGLLQLQHMIWTEEEAKAASVIFGQINH